MSDERTRTRGKHQDHETKIDRRGGKWRMRSKIGQDERYGYNEGRGKMRAR